MMIDFLSLIDDFSVSDLAYMGSVVRRRQISMRRKRRLFSRHLRSSNFHWLRTMSVYIWVIAICFLFFLVIRAILSRTIFASAYTIAEVKYVSGTISVYDDPYLYAEVSSYLEEKNIYKVKWWGKKEFIQHVREVFPLVDDIQLYYLYEHTVAVRLVFSQPDVVMVLPTGKRFAIYWERSFPLFSGNSLGSESLHIQLPSHLSHLDTLDWIFYVTSVEDLLLSIDAIQEVFLYPEDIIYVPGAERIIVTTTDGRLVYINLLQDTRAQLTKLQILKDYYTGFDSLREIDLGSLEDNRVIVRK
jgi:hypothetical protein